MNPRIRELWRQAVLNNTKTPMNFQDAAAEFAELIIHECLAFVEPSQYHKAYPDNMLGGIDGLELLYNRAEQIREHFDV